MKFVDVRKYVTGLLSASFVNKSVLDNLAEDENENLTYKGAAIEGGGITKLPIATTEKLGGVIVGDGLNIDETGILSALGGGGGSTITIDSELSLDSTNPVQNKVITAKLDEVFQSVSDGKSKVAAAITDKGIDTAADATFDIMAENIKKILPQNMNSASLVDASEIIYGLTDYSKEMFCIDASEVVYGFATYL